MSTENLMEPKSILCPRALLYTEMFSVILWIFFCLQKRYWAKGISVC